MCRFLMAKSPEPFPPGELLEKFADMAERSRAPDGDRQGDGWGAGWLDAQERWQTLKSSRPVWTDGSIFNLIPKSRIFLFHARSSSFLGHKNVLAYNQPFVRDSFTFVFNGLLQGVNLPVPVAGDIGSQKIWALLSDLLWAHEPGPSLERLAGLLDKNSRRIQALNIGLCDQKNLYAFCRYENQAGYYHLQFYESSGLKMVCSAALSGYDFRPLPLNEVILF